MDPTRWHEVKAVFAEAAEMAQEARPAFLASRCREDPALLAEVQSLFDAEDSGSGEMSAAIGREARFVAESIDAGRMASSTKPGARFGAYRVIRELGRGGMGSVYLAVRSDDEFQREVAIKVVRTLTPALLDRFRDERQILADLNHPGIARLLDGATTPEGLPYLVMEYIDGRPIDRDCDEKRLSVKDRLRLFLKVCEAVEFAHRNLVIHRDLKPSNILVSAEGEPKLLDFGIAKLLDAPGGRMDREATQTGVHLMTPDYASPEQVRGGPITTATDVYRAWPVALSPAGGATAVRGTGPISGGPATGYSGDAAGKPKPPSAYFSQRRGRAPCGIRSRRRRRSSWHHGRTLAARTQRRSRPDRVNGSPQGTRTALLLRLAFRSGYPPLPRRKAGLRAAGYMALPNGQTASQALAGRLFRGTLYANRHAAERSAVRASAKGIATAGHRHEGDPQGRRDCAVLSEFVPAGRSRRDARQRHHGARGARPGLSSAVRSASPCAETNRNCRAR
ncbi:MAG: serine/threonine-protein kinase [Bryobacterales bacterium]|nr:serine/threonine-protein kinase [Bryobacterales bacterium]